MSTHPLFPLTIADSTAQIILTPCPGTKGVDLHRSLEQIKASGAAVLLTFMTQTELDNNQLSDIGQAAQAQGMLWFHLPIVDDEAPEAPFLDAWKKAGPVVHDLIAKNKSIAVHCKGGSGRTGLISAQILLERGEALAPLMARIQAIQAKCLYPCLSSSLFKRAGREFEITKP